MNYKIFFPLILFSVISYSQENKIIDSLKNEITMLEKRVEEIKSKITDEILQNGYSIKAKSNQTLSEITMKDKVYGNVIDTIPDGSIIRIFGRKFDCYKVEHNRSIGFVSSYHLKIDDFLYLSLLRHDIASKKEKPSSSYKAYKHKTLDYSKPVHVRGHYRTTKSGKRVWVRPHTRKH